MAERQAQIDVDVLTFLLVVCTAVARAKRDGDDYAELEAAVELGWMAVRDAENATNLT